MGCFLIQLHVEIIPQGFSPRLCHFVHSSRKTGYFPCGCIFVVNTLLGCLVNSGSSSEQCALCSLFIICLDGSIHFLDSCLNTRLDSFVSVRFGLVYQDPLLCRFDISHNYTSYAPSVRID